MVRRLLDWLIDTPLADVGFAALFAAGLGIHGISFGRDSAVLLQTFAAIATTGVGLGTLSLTLLVTVTPSDRLATALEIVGRKLVRLIVVSLAALALAAVTYAVTISVIGNRNSTGALFGIASVLAFGATVRSGYLLVLTLRALLPAGANTSVPTPPTSILLSGPPPAGYELRQTSPQSRAEN